MHLQIGDVELSKTLLDVAPRALPEAFQFSEHAAPCLRLRFRHDVPNRIIRYRITFGVWARYAVKHHVDPDSKTRLTMPGGAVWLSLVVREPAAWGRAG
jgi:hypothetical protein